ANEMAFDFFLSPDGKALSIGYDAETGRLMESRYDLLASEARSAIFVAIAKGDVPQDVWFRLGRPVAEIWKRRTLLSWTGTMFEYLMPRMWHRSFNGTLLAEALDAAVSCQTFLGAQQNLPWGISECAYNDRDPSGVYAYQAFGLQQLAISREHSERTVI